MGNFRSKGLPEVSANPGNGSERLHKKRKYSLLEADDVSPYRDDTLSPRKKLVTTLDYVYKTFFVNGEKSDITIEALGCKWNLHKVYLCQSPYFRSMFKGHWSEQNEAAIQISIVDEMIDKKALDIALGSLYCHEVESAELVHHLLPTLAASCMLQLEGLLLLCQETMLEAMCDENVCSYYLAADRYGLIETRHRCLAWLERNLLLSRSAKLFQSITSGLLCTVLSSPNFLVMQVEMDVYNLMKVWVFLHLHPDSTPPLKTAVTEAQKYFEECSSFNKGKAFLSTELGLQFADAFRCLRLPYMLCDRRSVLALERDCIIPKAWLLPAYADQWQRMVGVFSKLDSGLNDLLEPETFERQSYRCGRVLESDTRYCWRWTGFSYGIDLIVTYCERTRGLCVKRNVTSERCNVICHQDQRTVALRFKVFASSSLAGSEDSKDTGLLKLTFKPDEEVTLLTLDESWRFPIYISARLLLASPLL